MEDALGGGMGLEEADPRSDDSIEGDAEDVGIVMRKSVRPSGNSGLGLAQLGLGRAGLGSGKPEEGVDAGDGGEGTDRVLSDVFERLGIDVGHDETQLEDIDVGK
jgi:hypothetical protein